MFEDVKMYIIIYTCLDQASKQGYEIEFFLPHIRLRLCIGKVVICLFLYGNRIFFYLPTQSASR